MDTRALNGTVPGPTIRIKPGDILTLDFQNKLTDQGSVYVHNQFSANDQSNVHFHGLHVSGELPSDDVTVPVMPGENRRYRTTIPEDHMPGTHWLHPHRHGSTALQVGGGAMLAMIVEDPPGSLPPQVEGAPEVLLVVMQMDSDELADVAQESNDGLFHRVGGPGEFKLVNGEDQPTIPLTAGEWTRLRIVYGAWRVGDLDLAVPGCEMALLAKDGVYIRDFPRPISLAPITPAGRADIMLRCPAAGSQYSVTSAGAAIASISTSAGAAAASAPLQAWTPAFPAYLRDLREVAPTPGCSCTTRLGGGGRRVNGRTFEADFVLHESSLGDVVERAVQAGNHPYHQHVNPFQLVAGFEESEYYKFGDWHDTVAGRSTVRFTAADFTGKIMLHCHRLQHEDEGMMALERINPEGTPCVCGSVPRAPWELPVLICGSVLGAALLAALGWYGHRRWQRRGGGREAGGQAEVEGAMSDDIGETRTQGGSAQGQGEARNEGVRVPAGGKEAGGDFPSQLVAVQQT